MSKAKLVDQGSYIPHINPVSPHPSQPPSGKVPCTTHSNCGCEMKNSWGLIEQLPTHAWLGDVK